MTLQKRLIRIVPQGPLMVGDASGVGSYEETVEYIPGSVVRGALAARFLEQCAQPAHKSDHAACPDRDTCPFWQVFGVSEPPRFSHCYAAQRPRSYPFPATARTCKRYPGLPNSDDDVPRHGVFDTLINQFVFDLLTDPQFPHREILQPALKKDIAHLREIYAPHCSECKKGVGPASGVYLVEGKSIRFARQPAIRRATHVGINRARGVAEDSLLFTQETVHPEDDVVFWGEVVADEETWPTIKAELEGAHTIGRGRSRGLGSVEIFIQSVVDASDLEKRVEDLNYEIKSVLRQAHEADSRVQAEFSGRFFSLTLRAPAILGQGRMPATRLEPSDIGVPEAVKRMRSWARASVVGGWNAAARLPHCTRLAVQAGAVYLFYAPSEAEEKELVQQLEALEIEGIGAWRERGFGQVTVCAPFHTVLAK